MMMIKSSFVLILILLDCCSYASSALDCRCRLGAKAKIIGGQSASENYVPWFGALLQNRRSFICGSFILNEYHIVTAAHCTTGRASSYSVALGQNSLKTINSRNVYQVEKVYNHPEFSIRKIELGHDISVLKLKKPIKFETGKRHPLFECDFLKSTTLSIGKIEPACVTFKTGSRFNDIMVAGLGSTTKIVERNGRATSGTFPLRLKYIAMYESYTGSNRLIFAKGKKTGDDTCNGDSGSPAHSFFNGRAAVIGLVSWGFGKPISKNVIEYCSGTTAFCRLSFEKNFIEKYANKNYCSI